MSEIPNKYIKVNIPLTERDYLSGNGEGVWVEVDEATRLAYDRDATGSGHLLSRPDVWGGNPVRDAW